MKFATLYSVPAKYANHRDRSFDFATSNDGESMVQESDALDTDINVMMERYAPSGMFPQIIKGAKYGDFATSAEFRDCLDSVREAQAAFQELPAKVRARFGHDPAEFIEFATKPENLEEMRKMGLAPEKPVDNTPTPAPTP